ncbi:Coenzyme F420 hydrogenase/dehydrogenase, beta subunit C-terminal domain [Spirosoma fluviale]|uniref:Coenzyme F420-reducing hydrogenase, beta subunit n=1 Tax=Spirosoma fluviale TaxID=1597977 RepID=A0A286GRY4_9BACT|nr:Coenzyme F420 hydrogenase/dehydrogenase, beta subunit C-terminal domain [Spirosoma fluviale]SOD98327.1 Coenzyme F420-reducing hydrogenase, beta subunit [Spirosoma fluviale]
MTDSRTLYETVIKGGYCIGCGACATKQDSAFNMKMDEFGTYVAVPKSDIDTNNHNVLSVCPFSGKSKNEDELADIFFPKLENRDKKIGKYIANYAGHVEKGAFRERGSSGGLGKWIGYKLLEKNKIDYFIQLVPNETSDTGNPLFDYGFFSDKNEVLKGSKSSYYPVTLDKVVARIKEQEGRYAITGVPCFIKTLRLLANEDAVLKERIAFTVGIVCGGMKSANQAKMIGWELGVKPENLIGIDFRRKYADRPASQKIYQVWSNADTIERYKNAGEIYGTDYGSGFFKPMACDYCDDVVGETADISLGDAWLPQFTKDPKGTSLIIVRNQEIQNLLNEAQISGELELSELTAEEVARSQDGGFRHRREALSGRIAKKELKQEWFPEKRVSAGEFVISPQRKEIYELREKIAQKSHLAFLDALQNGDLASFKADMAPLVKRYYTANHGNLSIRIKKKISRLLKRIFVL